MKSVKELVDATRDTHIREIVVQEPLFNVPFIRLPPRTRLAGAGDNATLEFALLTLTL